MEPTRPPDTEPTVSPKDDSAEDDGSSAGADSDNAPSSALWQSGNPWASADPTPTRPIYARPIGGPAPMAPPPPPSSEPKRTGGSGRWVALATGLSLMAGVVGGVVGAEVSSESRGSAPVASAPPGSSRSIIRDSDGIGDLVAQVERSVVSIRTARGQGTGVVLSADGEILTNAHVIQNPQGLSVTIPGEDQARRADVISTDEAGDLALLKVRDAGGLTPAVLGTSSDLRAGDDVVAIGNAIGLRGDPSVTRGIVSGLGRSIETLTGLIQTDAAINPGNSGGPLVNRAGEIVGINTAIRGGAQNIGFAIPIDTAKAFAERARSGQPAPATSFLGISSGIPDDGSPGAEVGTVEPGSAADEAGIEAGDRILAVEGQAVAGPAELGGLIRKQPPGSRVSIRTIRGGSERTVTVVLRERGTA